MTGLTRECQPGRLLQVNLIDRKEELTMCVCKPTSQAAVFIAYESTTPAELAQLNSLGVSR